MAKLPSATEFQILCLLDTERSGREVAALYEEATNRPISYGTLYSTIRRLAKQGWVRTRDAKDEDGRVRHARITASGVAARADARAFFEGMAQSGLPGGSTA